MVLVYGKNLKLRLTVEKNSVQNRGCPTLTRNFGGREFPEIHSPKLAISEYSTPNIRRLLPMLMLRFEREILVYVAWLLGGNDARLEYVLWTLNTCQLDELPVSEIRLAQL